MNDWAKAIICLHIWFLAVVIGFGFVGEISIEAVYGIVLWTFLPLGLFSALFGGLILHTFKERGEIRMGDRVVYRGEFVYGGGD